MRVRSAHVCLTGDDGGRADGRAGAKMAREMPTDDKWAGRDSASDGRVCDWYQM